MWELDYKESWAPKNWCVWTVVLEKTLEGPLDYKDVQPVHPKGDQSWIFIGRADAEAETPILWPPDVKNFSNVNHWKRLWCWERLKVGGEEDNTGWVGWMASPTQWTWVWVNSGSWCGRGSLAYCSRWGCKVWDTTEWLNWSELNWIRLLLNKMYQVGSAKVLNNNVLHIYY